MEKNHGLALKNKRLLRGCEQIDKWKRFEVGETETVKITSSNVKISTEPAKT